MTNALVVMARRPISGRVKTRLIPCIGADNAARLYQAFLADGLRQYATLGVAVRVYVDGCDEKLGLPVELHGASVHRQSGCSLAERMDAALRDTEAAGFQIVTIIGTDHPTLPSRYIVDGFAALRKSSSVAIGPATDGGFYLLGMHPYCSELITGRSYGHDRVFDETLEATKRTGLHVTILDPWYDIDTPDNLYRLISDLRNVPGSAPETQMQLEAIMRQHVPQLLR